MMNNILRNILIINFYTLFEIVIGVIATGKIINKFTVC